jgi:hypothetical protein
MRRVEIGKGFFPFDQLPTAGLLPEQFISLSACTDVTGRAEKRNNPSMIQRLR